MFYAFSNLGVDDKASGCICAANMSGIAVIIVAKINPLNVLDIIT